MRLIGSGATGRTVDRTDGNAIFLFRKLGFFIHEGVLGFSNVLRRTNTANEGLYAHHHVDERIILFHRRRRDGIAKTRVKVVPIKRRHNSLNVHWSLSWITRVAYAGNGDTALSSGTNITNFLKKSQKKTDF
jgi:hypothetical protein